MHEYDSIVCVQIKKFTLSGQQRHYARLIANLSKYTKLCFMKALLKKQVCTFPRQSRKLEKRKLFNFRSFGFKTLFVQSFRRRHAYNDQWGKLCRVQCMYKYATKRVSSKITENNELIIRQCNAQVFRLQEGNRHKRESLL